MSLVSLIFKFLFWHQGREWGRRASREVEGHLKTASILILLDEARGGSNTSENFFQFPADYTHLCPEIPANIQCTIFALFLLLKPFQHNFPIYNLDIVKYILFYGKPIKPDTDPLNVYI